MNNNLDAVKAGKRMPYTTPDGFFDKLEEDIWKEVKNDCLDKDDNVIVLTDSPVERKPSKLRLFKWSAIAVAASVAFMLVFNLNTSNTRPATLNDVDQAFSQLTTDDQSYLLDVYQNDVFINE
jgi:hypothetical protein